MKYLILFPLYVLFIFIALMLCTLLSLWEFENYFPTKMEELEKYSYKNILNTIPII